MQDGDPPNQPRPGPRPAPLGEATAHAADLELAGAVLAGAPGALDRFVARLDGMFRFATVRNAQYGGPLTRQELEDCVQDSTITIWQKLGEFRGESSLPTWAFRICDFTLRNAGRKALRRRAPAPEDVPEATGASGDLRAIDEVDAVETAMARLPAEDAAIVRAKHYQELTFEQIGGKFSLPANTVKTRYYRALTVLKRHLRSVGES